MHGHKAFANHEYRATAGTWANAIVLTVALTKDRDINQAYANTLLLISSVIECAMGIFCACLATSKPAISVLWRNLGAVLRGEKPSGRFRELRPQAGAPETPPNVKETSIEEVVEMRRQAPR